MIDLVGTDLLTVCVLNDSEFTASTVGKE